jgi:ABC-type bacteriocin/lantibiotic exporter with double-glycine peptidase domain/CRP-like cAMP-binding protein
VPEPDPGPAATLEPDADAGTAQRGAGEDGAAPDALREVGREAAAPRLELRGLELLTDLPAGVRLLVAEAFERVDFEFGEVLMREGDPADSYWVLVDGRVRVVREGADGAEVTLATLGPGATFGEGALLRQGFRTSTVRAATPGNAMRLDASVLRALAATQPTVMATLSRIRRRHEVSDLLRLASPLARVAGGALPEVVDHLVPVEVEAGETREVGTTALYLVEDGRLVVRAAGEGTFPRYVRRGDLVGEATLLAGAETPELLEAISDARLLELRRSDLDAVIAAHPDLRQGLADLAAIYERRQSAARVPLDFARPGGGSPAAPGPATGEADAGAGQPEPPPGTAPAGTGAVPPAAVEESVPEPVAASGSEPPARRRVRRRPVIRQIDEMDCGVAALAMVCRHHGKYVALSRLRTMVGTGLDGTSAAGIVAAARELGFEARVVKASKSELPRLPLPFIGHWQGDHWVMVTNVQPHAVLFDDPALGHRRVPIEEFKKHWSGYMIEARPGPGFERGGSRFEGMDWIGRLVRPHLPRIWVVAGMSVGLNALSLSLEVVTQIVIDRISGGHHHGSQVASILLVLGAVTVVLTFGTLAQRLLLLRTAAALDRDGLRVLSERLLSLPLSYFTSRRTGDLQRRLDGLRDARRAVSDMGVIGLGLAAQLLASLGLLFYYSVPVGIAFVVCIPAYLLLTRAELVRLSPATASLEEEAGRYASRQVEIVKGIETAKALAAETPLQESLVDQQTALNGMQLGIDRLRAIYGAISEGLGFAVLAAFLAIGAVQVVDHSLTIGGLVACVTLVALATFPMQQLVILVDSLQHARTLADRAQDVFDSEPEQGEDRSTLAPVPSISGQIAMKDVSFFYGKDESRRVLDNISVEIPAGATVAVVGRSGSGKTTFARCVAGLITPTSGTVSFDGVDTAGLDHRQLRRHIGLVLQETYLFSDTIENNIAFGSELDPARVREVAQLANAADFIERLPLAYATKIGESGLALSGGQKQRVAIARALYRRPALLVMDEATSALDTESERAIQENLTRVLGDRTAIVIAHRLSTVRHADLILVLDQGRLVEHGTHDELVARRGLYFLLTAQQLDL